eukprot:CAMPEP_0115715336 /NCGR_PEP_ID=MMETSP0272-20121206/75730_1 /TAXON_ID=71861 /ORGANISM="Scrippsiella trochoidea, Strain CCMP3099" /LENGTH=46 /DNA_ID= /DNA_START= /DNA_END= /DNA_ORIENTATION=
MAIAYMYGLTSTLLSGASWSNASPCSHCLAVAHFSIADSYKSKGRA